MLWKVQLYIPIWRLHIFKFGIWRCFHHLESRAGKSGWRLSRPLVWRIIKRHRFQCPQPPNQCEDLKRSPKFLDLQEIPDGVPRTLDACPCKRLPEKKHLQCCTLVQNIEIGCRFCCWVHSVKLKFKVSVSLHLTNFINKSWFPYLHSRISHNSHHELSIEGQFCSSWIQTRKKCVAQHALPHSLRYAGSCSGSPHPMAVASPDDSTSVCF